VSEQALFKMLEINPALSHVVLCLDHDSAGIEASEKIEDTIMERNISCSRLLSNQKDWNEDLRAKQNLAAIPAEEHPQHFIKNELCKEILMFAKELEKIEIEHSDGENYFRKAQKQSGLQAEAMKMASAVFLCIALKEYRQLGNAMTAEEIVRRMSDEFRAYQNRSRWDTTLSGIETELSTLKKQNGIVSESERTATSKRYEKVSLELLKSTIRLELAQQKQVETPAFKMA
jgi:DNA primase